MSKLLWLLIGALSAVLGRRESTAAPPAADEDYRAAHLEHWRSERRVGCITAVAAIITAGAAVVALYGLFQAVEAAKLALRQIEVAQQQAEAAQRQVAVMADQEKRQLRAYLVPGSGFAAEVTNYTEGQLPAAHIKIENMGQTPPYEVTVWTAMTTGDYPETRPVNINPVDCAAAANDPGSHKVFFGRDATIPGDGQVPLSPDDIHGIKERRKALYFAGRVCYRDIFGAQHWTDFCVRWTGIGDGSDTITALTCRYGNAADIEPP